MTFVDASAIVEAHRQFRQTTAVTPETSFEFVHVVPAQIRAGVDGERLQPGIHHFADAGDFRHRQRREIGRKAAFLEASTELYEKIEANILAQEIDAMYLEWGLASINGLNIDGEAATGAQLLAKGPDDLMFRSGFCKERLSQSSLYFATTQVSDADAASVQWSVNDATLGTTVTQTGSGSVALALSATRAGRSDPGYSFTNLNSM